MSTTETTNATNGRLLREPEAAEYLGLSVRTLQDWRIRGCGPCFVRMSGRAVRYRLVDLETWAESRIASSTSTPPTA